MSKKFGLWLLLPLILLSHPVFAKERPVEDFFRKPEFAGPGLSPDGRYLSIMAPYENRMNLFVIDLDKGMKATQATSITGQDVQGGGFVSNERLIFTMDRDGNEDFGLYAVDRDGRKPKALIEPDTLRNANVVHRLPDDDDHVMIAYNKTRFGYPDIFRMNINTGRTYKAVQNPNNVAGWLLDQDGRVRIGIDTNGTENTILYRSDEEAEWESLATFEFDEPQWSPVAFDFDNKTLYVLSNLDADTAGLFTYDPETKTMGKLIYRDPDYDVAGPIMSRHLQRIVGVSIEKEKPETVWFNKEWAQVQATLDHALPDTHNAVVSASDDESRLVVAAYSDINPGRYYLYDRAKGQLRHLVTGRKWIDPDEMAPMKSISYKSRDGLTIHGYLTLPKDYDGKGRIPLIVNPHGGPYGVRDSWGFNPEHQFFADRGYATLQMNFRGSGGYGHEFMTAGYGKWGQEMQDDITDGVKWAIEEGFADPERVCIFGASYGGYATMAGLTFTPDLYKCGINYVGVTDVALLFETAPKRWEAAKKQMEKQIGDPEDTEFMRRVSPLYHVDKIKAPLMIVHGRRDPRVVMQHADDLRDELDDQKKPYVWLVQSSEGHGFKKEENVIDLYKRMDKFLKENL